MKKYTLSSDKQIPKSSYRIGKSVKEVRPHVVSNRRKGSEVVVYKRKAKYTEPDYARSE